ncbi:MAG: HEPN domain-containing protein [Cyanobacteriota bacterium]
MNEYLEWLIIAESNLQIGKSYHKFIDDNVRFEEFCFELQQCAEKSLKGLLTFHHIEFYKTHNIGELFKILMKNNISIPEYILDSAVLTRYAVTTRYPGDIIMVTEQEYKEAIEMAETIFYWVKELLDPDK